MFLQLVMWSSNRSIINIAIAVVDNFDRMGNIIPKVMVYVMAWARGQ